MTVNPRRNRMKRSKGTWISGQPQQFDPGERGIRRKRDWNHGQIWCSDNDKQRGKHTRPVKRLRD